LDKEAKVYSRIVLSNQILREEFMKSFLAYMGGKSLLVPKIINKIPDHQCYCEVFAGAAWLLFKKEESPVEIINDINTDLVTLYRVIKHHPDEFIRYLRWILVARDEFNRFKAETPETLTDIQKAVRFYYLLKNGYSSRIKNPSFSISTLRRAHFNLMRIEEELSAVHLRLSRVYVENMNYDLLIKRFDREGTFFYVDPPYYGCEDYYGDGIFSRDDFARLQAVLADIKGKFLMSINDKPDIRQIFKDFYIEEVQTTYLTAGANKKKRVTELLISNYRPVKN
jgi:DNA adenine methylase